MVLESAKLIVDTRNAIAGSHAHVLKLGAPAPAMPGDAARLRESDGVIAMAGSSGCRWRSSLRVCGLPLLLAACGRGMRMRPVRDPAALPVPQPLPAPSRSSLPRATRGASARPHRQPPELDYPADRRQIIVVSDGSTDETLPRAGEVPRASSTSSACRRAARRSRSTPASRRPPRDRRVRRRASGVRARRAAELVAPFADPGVGAVTGELLLDCRVGTVAAQRRTAAAGAGPARMPHRAPHLRRRRSHRRSPTASASTGGTKRSCGASRARRIDARRHRRDLRDPAIAWRPLPADTILDDVLTPMRVVLAGCRVVFTERARAFDRAAVDADTEARRKMRTLAGNYQILALEPRLLLPWRNPVWLQYVSHKVGRLLVPYALLAMFVASIALVGHALCSRRALAAQVGVLPARRVRRGARARGAAPRWIAARPRRRRSRRGAADEGDRVMGDLSGGAHRLHVRDDELRGRRRPVCRARGRRVWR